LASALERLLDDPLEDPVAADLYSDAGPAQAMANGVLKTLELPGLGSRSWLTTVRLKVEQNQLLSVVG
jgi:hypothetical protein